MKRLVKTNWALASLLLSLFLVLQAGCATKPASNHATVGASAYQAEEEDPDNHPSSSSRAEGDQEKNGEIPAGNNPGEEGQKNQPDEGKKSDPAPPPKSKFPYPDAVRGIYVTAHSAGGSRFNKLLELVNKTELNTMVIDIKDDYGYVTFKLDGTPYEEFSKPIIKDPKALIETLKKNQIYPIARIVVFKDSVLAQKHPEFSFLQDGKVWKNGRGDSFVNPFLPEVWKHNVEIAKKAAELGFPEIQFDYVRFPEGFEKRDQMLKYSMGEYKDRKPSKFSELEEQYQAALQEHEKTRNELKAKVDQLLATYNELKARLEQEKSNSAVPPSDQNGNQSVAAQGKADNSLQAQVEAAKKALDEAQALLSAHEKKKPPQPNFSEKERNIQLRVDAVTDFVAYAKKELEPLGVKVSVDIFGYTTTLPEAPGIGQNFIKICQHVDVISSMIYPSHWGPGYFNIPKPDKEPYRLVKEYLKAEKGKLTQLEKPPKSRPWIQDFTASWLGKGNYISYGKAEVEAQIRALNEEGIMEFLIWNANNSYTENVDYTPLTK